MSLQVSKFAPDTELQLASSASAGIGRICSLCLSATPRNKKIETWMFLINLVLELGEVSSLALEARGMCIHVVECFWKRDYTSLMRMNRHEAIFWKTECDCCIVALASFTTIYDRQYRSYVWLVEATRTSLSWRRRPSTLSYTHRCHLVSNRIFLQIYLQWKPYYSRKWL